MRITRVLARPSADTRHSELTGIKKEGSREPEEASLVLDKREMVWPGAQAREGRKQDDTSWTDAVRGLGSKRLHQVATDWYQLEGEVRSESLVVAW